MLMTNRLENSSTMSKSTRWMRWSQTFSGPLTGHISLLHPRTKVLRWVLTYFGLKEPAKYCSLSTLATSKSWRPTHQILPWTVPQSPLRKISSSSAADKRPWMSLQHQLARVNSKQDFTTRYLKTKSEESGDILVLWTQLPLIQMERDMLAVVRTATFEFISLISRISISRMKSRDKRINCNCEGGVGFALYLRAFRMSWHGRGHCHGHEKACRFDKR